MDHVRPIVPNRIREHRLRHGLSQAALAALCDTTTQQICKLENGQRQLSGKWLAALSRALTVPRAALLYTVARDGTEPLDCDLVHDSVERTLLRFWRALPQEGQDAVFLTVTDWARQTVNRSPTAQSR